MRDTARPLRIVDLADIPGPEWKKAAALLLSQLPETPLSDMVLILRACFIELRNRDVDTDKVLRMARVGIDKEVL